MLKNLLSNRRLQIILIISILMVLSGIGYFLYSHSLLPTPILVSSYNCSEAAQVLSNPETIVYSKEDRIYLNNLEDREVLVSSPNDPLNKNISLTKISNNRKYLVWSSDTGISVLDIAHCQVFSIAKDFSTFAFLNNQDDVIFSTSNQLAVFNPEKRSISKKIDLPDLKDNSFYYTYLSPSPDNSLVYLSGKNASGSSHDVLLAFSKGIIKQDFLLGIRPGSEPIWFDNKKLLIQQNYLSSYDIDSGNIQEINSLKDFSRLSQYSLSPEINELVFLNYHSDYKRVLLDKKGRPLFQTGNLVYLTESGLTDPKFLFTEFDSQLLKDDKAGFIKNIGWLSQDKLWFTYGRDSQEDELWTASLDGTLKQVK